MAWNDFFPPTSGYLTQSQTIRRRFEVFLTLRARMTHVTRVRTKCKQKTRAGVENAVARDTDTGMTRPGPGAAFVPGGPYEAGRARCSQSTAKQTSASDLRVVPHRAMHLN